MDEYAFLSEHGTCSIEKIDGNLFYPEGEPTKVLREQEHEAKKLCGKCMVKTSCLQIALKNNEQGIWGGTTERERYLLKRRIQRMPKRN
jgi:WhiB family redox-sensing transcriptional regulator